MSDRKHIVLVPGLMCDQAVWAEQINGLSDLAQCQVADHGLLDSLPAMATQVLARAPEQFMLVGHSMGGRVALEVMRQAPHRVTHLVLMDTGYLPLAAGDAGKKEVAGRQHLLEIARNRGTRAMGMEWVQGMVHPDRLNDGQLIEAIVSMIARHTADQFAAQIHALINRPDGTDVLRTVRCPTLMLCGRQDAWSPLARHEDMAALVPGSKVMAIEDAGHMVTMEQPTAVTQVLRDWLIGPTDHD